jgi:glyoxylate/hydroxypyruvate reductase
MMRAFTTLDLTQEQAAKLKDALDSDALLQARDCRDEAEARERFDTCEVALGNPPAAWLTENSSLRWLQLESVGFGEYIALDWNKLDSRLRITNLAGFFAEPVPESILAGVLALLRGVDRLVLDRQRGHWCCDALRPRLKTLAGANVVLFGFGAINKRVAELLAPFGCRVTTITREPGALDRALPHADLVIAVVPDLPGTRNVFDRRRLATLKSAAILANFGRGSLIDEDALADELESGRLGGAVIDVTREEPLPPDHRFWRTPNLILTQHTGGGSHDEIDRKLTWFIENLSRYRRGEMLVGLIDISRGY